MKITSLKTNHMDRPLGFQMDNVTISYIVEETRAKKQEAAQVMVALDEGFTDLIYDSGKSSGIDSIAYRLPIELKPRTRYYWKVKVWADNGEEAESEVTWFETPKGKEEGWKGYWITPKYDKDIHPIMKKEIEITKPVKQVRAYMVGLGSYELFLNGEKVGDEYLLPGVCDFGSWIQYQTYELELKEGKNQIEMLLGNGWYKGRYGLKQKAEMFGDRFACIAEIHIVYEDGREEVIGTDTSWRAKRSIITASSIYDGESQDARIDGSEEVGVEEIELGYERLEARLSPKMTIHERLKPIEVIKTPAKETVLDMGQNMVGWLEFKTKAKAGEKIYMQFGELLQEGNFYRDNLRTALAEFTYIADGKEAVVRPYSTFYGFRYVKIEGWEGEINPEDFTGCVIYSDMEEIGQIETSEELINKLFTNAKWGQKGNFLDTPTDCPQRDERMGWTGDAQIFCGTASFNMDTYEFYTKFGHDLAYEQNKLNGSVPFVVPTFEYPGDGSTAWGEAATVIPWEVYTHFGDRTILEKQFDSMKAWVDYMRRDDVRMGNKRLWKRGFHFADWLALDGKVDGGVYGGTDPHYVASAYYYYSANIVAKAAKVLGREEEAEEYGRLAEEIREAFQREYFTAEGRLSIDTQTAYVMALFMDLVPENAKERTVQGLKGKIKANNYKLCTGFVGTPYLCRAMSDNGLNDLSYILLMNREFPSWIYEVLMGATTVWERWNSVLPDGKISSTGMNSMNHYAYGSIVEWMYRNMIGIKPVESKPGFRQAVIAPQPDYHIRWAKGEIKTPCGVYRSEWKLDGIESLTIKVEVPFGGCAKVVLPDADAKTMRTEEGVKVVQEGENAVAEVPAGEYEFQYKTTKEYRKYYSIECSYDELMENEKTKEIMLKYFTQSELDEIPFRDESCTMEEIMYSPFVGIDEDIQAQMDQEFRSVK